MPLHFEPKTSILAAAQRQIWPQLAPAVALSFVLYGGTAVALHLGHRRSLDFDFFSATPLTKRTIETSFSFMKDVDIVHEEPDTLVIAAKVASERVKISFFGNLATSMSRC